MSKIEERIKNLLTEIELYDKQYYDENQSNIDDAKYDELKKEFESLKKHMPVWLSC